MAKIADYFRAKKDLPTLLSDTNLELHFKLLVSRVPTPGMEEEDATEKQILYLEMLEMIRSGYDDKTWEAFYQTTIAGKTSTEVADLLGMTAANVRKIKSRVLTHIKSEFFGLLD